MTYFTKDIVYFVCTVIELNSKRCTHFRVEEVRVQLKGVVRLWRVHLKVVSTDWNVELCRVLQKRNVEVCRVQLKRNIELCRVQLKRMINQQCCSTTAPHCLAVRSSIWALCTVFKYKHKYKHCQGHNGPKTLCTLTHSTSLVQSRSFNKLWYLGQTSWFCLAEGENYIK